ncbi:MAG: SatD family protein [Actinomycetes bacterium]
MKPRPCVALLGDLVGSRASVDRAALHRRLRDALTSANERFAPIDPLRVTIGDEFQGVFATVGEALAATYAVRLGLGPGDDVRFGVGRGSVRIIDRENNVQDGTAWWAAREAIEQVERRARGAHAALRTGLDAGADEGPVSTELRVAVEAVDALLAGLDRRGRTILVARLAGRPQSDVARQLGISASAVSQRVRRGGLAVIADAITALKGVR